MKLLDLATKCGVTIQDIAYAIEVQFKDSLTISPSTHVPDKYVSHILYMYEQLQPKPLNRDFTPQEDTSDISYSDDLENQESSAKSDEDNEESGGSNNEDSLNINYDENEDDEKEPDENNDTGYSVTSVARELGIAEGRVINILRHSFYFYEDTLKTECIIPDRFVEKILNYYDMLERDNHAQSFANHYLRDLAKKWNNPVIEKRPPNYAPGTIVEGEVYQIDYAHNLIKVQFKEVSHEKFWSNKKVIDRPAKKGIVSFDEWDWNVCEHLRVFPEIGSLHQFLILQYYYEDDLIVSRRQAITPLKPEDGEGEIICHHNDKQFVCIRHSNESYGFVTYSDLYPFDIEDGEKVELKIKKIFKKDFGDKTFYFAQYEVVDEKSENRLRESIYMLGLNKAEHDDGDKILSIDSWDVFVKAYHSNQLIEGIITETNAGGYILDTVGEESYELFCPFSKSPTWIDSAVSDNLIGAKLMVRIESDPEEEDENNTIVSAKLKPEDYNGILQVGGYYSVIICSCNKNGANVLVEKCVPMFVPNKFIGWRKDNNAQINLKPGDTCYVKILKNDKGMIASIRDTVVNPWVRVEKQFPVGIVVETEIIQKEEHYVRVDLGEHIGHLPATEISWTDSYIPDCREIDLPSPLRVVVTGYHDKSKTVQVSLRRLTPDPWDNIDNHAPRDITLPAHIVSLGKSGAILEVGEYSLKGYLSFRDVDWCRYVDKDSFPYAVGDKIDVKIIHINRERRQLTCSIKVLLRNPWEELRDVEKVEGLVLKVYPDRAEVRLANGIECICREGLDPAKEGTHVVFNILVLNSAAQKIVISCRRHEIEKLNKKAVDNMFKPYRKLTDADKNLIPVSEDDGTPIYRNFKIKEVSSTGRVTAVYAEEDDEFEKGILLPGAITIGAEPVNVIFARQIAKQYLEPGAIVKFRITHSYEGFNYAVLALDAAELLDLDHIATDDLATLSSSRPIIATVLTNISSERNLFLTWNGYFGYIPRSVLLTRDDENAETLRIKATALPKHPGQMIRFNIVDAYEEEQEKEEEKANKDLTQELDADLCDCYDAVTRLEGFNLKTPDHYPYVLQVRFDPERYKPLYELLEGNPTYLSSRTFFLDCHKSKGENGHVISIFDNEISITAFGKDSEDGDEIRITKYELREDQKPSTHRVYARPLRIDGEKLHIVQINSSALPPVHQNVDILMDLLKYNREVLPALNRLRRGYMEQRGNHYLTLKELLEMSLKREEELCNRVIEVQPNQIKEIDGIYEGGGFEFDADEDAFDSITSKDDNQEGIKVQLKMNDSSDFRERKPSGVLNYKGNGKWIINFYRDREVNIDNLSTNGFTVKRYSNSRHLKKQIRAIENYVFERNGLDIFRKIANGKFRPVEMPSAESIEVNPRINLANQKDSQANALKMALGNSQLTLIQGPPGTGKSTVIVDIIQNLVMQHKKVLVCTQSVAPVKELYFKLSGRRDGEKVKDPIKVNGVALRCSYLRDDESLEISGSVEKRREAIKDMMLLLDQLEKANNSTNGIGSINSEDTKQVLKSLEVEHADECNAVKRKFAKEIFEHNNKVLDVLRDYHAALDKKDVEDFGLEQRSLDLGAVDVVFGTCIGVGVSPYLRDLHFDTLIIDEAGKANYAETLVPMMMANNYILVGDDCQLPPYTNNELVKELATKRMIEAQNTSEEESEEGMVIKDYIDNIIEDVGKSLFGDLKPRLPETNKTMLSKQFRMHPEIGDFVSKLFYEGKVTSMVNPADRQLNINGLEHPIIFIDTSGMGYEAHESNAGKSLYNEGEIQVIETRLMPMLEAALDAGKTVGILSPYGAQVEKMRQCFPKLRKHIFTIDSIQGEEYDIVVFSFVRNTRYGTLNFVDDLRRLNVSFSRARCNLIMVGHLDTLKDERLHVVDRDAVMAVYKEIENKKVELVVQHGAMQQLFDDYPPESSPVVSNLDHPYYTFEDCMPMGGGQFSCFYKGRFLNMYNPVLKGLRKDEIPKSFRTYLIGYIDGKPQTMIEPIAYWLQKGYSPEEFEFTGKLLSATTNDLTIELSDRSKISFSIPQTNRFKIGSEVVIKVTKRRFFTINECRK